MACDETTDFHSVRHEAWESNVRSGTLGCMTYTTTVADDCARAPGVDRSRSHRVSRRRLVLVRESAGSYQQVGSDQSGTDTALGALRAAVPGVLGLDVAVPDEEDLRGTLSQLQQTINQLCGLRARIAGELEQRAIRAAGPGRRQQGLREARRRTGDITRLSPTQVKQDGETGRRLADSPGAQEALAAGSLPAGHARVLAQTLHDLGQAHPQRQQVHDQLVTAAQHEDLKTFGRTCRRLLAETDQAAAQKKLDRAHTRRRLRVCETEDGMTAVHGQGAGWDAEIVHTALHAFARPQPNDTRAPEQRTWDALVATCRAALDAGAGTTNRAVRPHVLVTVKHPDRDSDPALVEGAWTGPLPWTETRRHLTDAGISGVLLDANDAPIAVSETVRTVPAGLWKALQVRDRTCIAVGCDVPAGWCQVMHLKVPYRLGGKLSLENAAAGCTTHHRKLDHQGWQITWIGKQPVLHPPDQPPGPPEPPGPPKSPNPPGPLGPHQPPKPPGTPKPPKRPGPSKSPEPSGSQPPQTLESRRPSDTTSRPPPDAATGASPDEPSRLKQSVANRPSPNGTTRIRREDSNLPEYNDGPSPPPSDTARTYQVDVSRSRHGTATHRPPHNSGGHNRMLFKVGRR